MATMTAQQRTEAGNDAMSEASSTRDALALTKADFRAAVDAADQWVSDNQSSYNTALPQAARDNLTAAQKSWILTRVLEKRYAVGV